MNFILTTYIYPIKEPIWLSRKLKIQLDNPRTDDEIEIILNHLEKSLNSPNEAYEYDKQIRIPIKSTNDTEGILTVESSLNDFEKNYSSKDEYVKSFFVKNKKYKTLEKIARMWMVARFDDEEQIKQMQELSKEFDKSDNPGFFMFEKGNPIIDNCEKTVNLSYLYSLLIHKDFEYYHGQSFILHHHSYEIQFPKINKSLNNAVMYFGLLSYNDKFINESDRWLSFYHIRERLIEVSKKFDETIDNSNQEKILYIANLLKVIGNEIDDERYRLVTLVSIIELLLTHSPNYNRFNVEDSISKQFKLKTSILVYQNDKNRELDWIKNRLKDIYNQRSNIAHGNFKSLDDFLKKEVKNSKDEDMNEDFVLELLSRDVYMFIRAIIEEYIKDRKLVDFMKEN